MSNEIPIEGTSEQVAAYCKDFHAMQATFGSVPKNKSAPINKAGDRFSFTDYDGLVEYLRPFFEKHGFFHQSTPGSSVEKIVGAEGEYLAMVASGEVILVHQGGALARAKYAMPASTPRDAGGIHTYCKRYALAGLAGISSDEDTDAAGIQNPPPQQAQKARQEPAKQEPKAQPSGDKERAKKGADAIQAYLKEVAANEKVFADYMSQVSAYSQDTHGDKVSALVAKGWDRKVADVYLWAKKNIGKAREQTEAEYDRADREFKGDMTDHLDELEKAGAFDKGGQFGDRD